MKTLYLYTLNNGTYDQMFWKMFFIHVLAWLGQFVGHGVFEKRSPALFSNFMLTLNAPFFVTAEVL